MAEGSNGSGCDDPLVSLLLPHLPYFSLKLVGQEVSEESQVPGLFENVMEEERHWLTSLPVLQFKITAAKLEREV